MRPTVKLISFLLVFASVLTVLTLRVAVPCAYCGDKAITEPAFIFHTCALPDVLHFECLEDA